MESETRAEVIQIILTMLHESTPDIYRIAEHAKRCLPLLREHSKRDALLEMSIDAGDSARARGAHEVSRAAESRRRVGLTPLM